MQYRPLGLSGLTVSRLGLGTLTWGRDTETSEAADQLRAFLDAGGNFLETSASYGNGDSEKVIGGFVDTLVPRNEIVIALRTGLTTFTPSENENNRNQSQLSLGNTRKSLISSLDASLKRLNLEYVDLWQVSNWDNSTPLEETLSALDYAVSSGRVRYIGASNFLGWQIARAYSLQNPLFGRAPLIACENEYSLLNRKVEDEVLPACLNLGIGFIAWSPLGRGVLTGKYQNGIPSDSRAASTHFASFLQPYLTKRASKIVEAINVAASGLGYSPIEVALAWVRDSLGVTSALIGARNLAQFRGSLTVEEIELPDEIRVALDEVSS